MAGTLDLSALSGNGEASLPSDLFAVLFDNLRVDHDDGLILLGAYVDHDDPLEHSDLRRGKSHAVGIVHGLLHILDQLPELGSHLLHFLCFLLKDRVSQFSDHSK